MIYKYYIFFLFFLNYTLNSTNILDNKLNSILYQQEEKPITIDYNMISRYFHLPLKAAAKELKICESKLKKICRKNGIKRWPHRKIKSINSIIEGLESSNADIEELNKYKDIRNNILQNINTPYTEFLSKSLLNSLNSQMPGNKKKLSINTQEKIDKKETIVIIDDSDIEEKIDKDDSDTEEEILTIVDED